ncbi:hypothetical protein ACQ4PT_046388 [Festuca glaucescens]
MAAAAAAAAAAPWKQLFFERVHDSFTVTGFIRDSLAAVARELALPMRGRDDDRDLAMPLRESDMERALLQIDKTKKMLAEASKFFSVAISALGTVEALALRFMSNEHDDKEMQDRPRACVARERACTAYDALTSSRGHLAAAGRLVATPGTPSQAVEEERLAVLATVHAAMNLLAEAQALRSSDATHADVAAATLLEEAAVTWPGPPVGAQGATFSAALSSVLGPSLPGNILRIALSGAVPEIEAAQAALRVGAAAAIKPLKVASAGEWSGCHNAAFRALDAAHRELSDLLVLSTEVDAVFRRCAPPLGPDRAAPCLSSDSWGASGADVESHGRAALHRVWSALSNLDYCFGGALQWESSSLAG